MPVRRQNDPYPADRTSLANPGQSAVAPQALLPACMLHTAWLMVLAACYFLRAQRSGLWDFQQIHVSPVWLPAEVALAAVLLRRPGVLPGVAIGSFATEVARAKPLPAAVVIALTVTQAAAVGAAALRRLEYFDPVLDRPRHIVLLIGIGANASPLMAAMGGVITLTTAGIIPPHEAGIPAALWASDDALGVLLLTTLVLAWRGPRTRVYPRVRPGAKALVPLCALGAGMRDSVPAASTHPGEFDRRTGQLAAGSDLLHLAPAAALGGRHELLRRVPGLLVQQGTAGRADK
jgi:hypothetical protein